MIIIFRMIIDITISFHYYFYFADTENCDDLICQCHISIQAKTVEVWNAI